MTTLLLRGGRVHAPTAPTATALAVTGDTVTWVGTDPPPSLPVDRVIDVGGALITPAFVDAHVHATATGLLLGGLDLTTATSLADCLTRIRRYRTDHPDTLIWGHGWDETTGPDNRPPTLAEIDDAAGGAAVYASRIDVHSALVSSPLITQAPGARHADGFSTIDPVRRQAHHTLRRAAMAALPTAQRHRAQQRFLRHAATRGVACVHECAGPDISGRSDFTALLALAADPTLPTVVGYWGEPGAFQLLDDTGAAGLAGDLFVDGSIGSHTAALRDPYADDPSTHGSRYLTAGDIADHVISCTHRGVQAGFHVIGDAAADAVIDGFTRAEHAVGTAALAACRHRLEHAEMLTPQHAEALARWGVAISAQPLFDAAWGGENGMYTQRLGPVRGPGLNNFHRAADAGAVLAFGSDSPVTPVDPWTTVRAAVHHRSPGFGIPPHAAFTAHTATGWWLGGSAPHPGAGELTPGAPATYAIWHAPDLAVPSEGQPPLPRLDPTTHLPRCLATVRDGHPLFDPDGLLPDPHPAP